jgi:NMD protein affecting ribosome stability and mRNA decay
MQKNKLGRKDRLIKQKNNDVYMEKSKFQEPTLCPECGSLYVKGRWTWETTDESVNNTICPACRRIADNYPAGTIEIKGTFFSEHSEEIMNLVRNTEQQEKKDHALERIIETRTISEGVTITTTGIHLARRIGEALSRSYKGNYAFQYLDADKGIRVQWERALT